MQNIFLINISLFKPQLCRKCENPYAVLTAGKNLRLALIKIMATQ